MPTERRRIMLAAAERLEAKREAIAEVMAAEVGASALLRQVAGFTTQVQGSTIPTDKPGRLSMTLRQPVSIVSWNGPILLAARAIAYPLALVDTVLFRASEASPRTHSLVAEALYKAGLRAGAIKFIVNIPEDAAGIIDTLIAHSAVRRVNFTGSTKVGRIIAEKYAIQLKRCLLELDGKAPFLELHDADLDGAADAAIFGAFLHQGEICMSRFVVVETIADAFLEKFVAKVAALPLGDPAINPGSVSRPLVDARSGPRIAELIGDAFAKGVTLAIGDKGEGAVMPATIVDHVRGRHRDL